MKAIIPAAGLGTRFLPSTKAIPKELLPVIDKPVIQYVVEEALAPESVDGVIIVNSHDKPGIVAHFSEDVQLEKFLVDHGKQALADKVHEAGELPVAFVYQARPLGLGHAVLCAANFVGNEPFFVLLGDYFVPNHQMCKQMAEVSAAHNNASVIAVAPVPEDQVSRYGVIAGECIGSLDGSACEPEEQGAVWKISGMVEKPAPEEAPSRLFIVGRYLLSPRIMDLLAVQQPGAGGEIQLTDAMARLLEEEEMYAVVVDPSVGFDTGTPSAWAASNVRMALMREDIAPGFQEALQGMEF